MTRKHVLSALAEHAATQEKQRPILPYEQAIKTMLESEGHSVKTVYVNGVSLFHIEKRNAYYRVGTQDEKWLHRGHLIGADFWQTLCGIAKQSKGHVLLYLFGKQSGEYLGYVDTQKSATVRAPFDTTGSSGRALNVEIFRADSDGKAEPKPEPPKAEPEPPKPPAIPRFQKPIMAQRGTIRSHIRLDNKNFAVPYRLAVGLGLEKRDIVLLLMDAVPVDILYCTEFTNSSFFLSFMFGAAKEKRKLWLALGLNKKLLCDSRYYAPFTIITGFYGDTAPYNDGMRSATLADLEQWMRTHLAAMIHLSKQSQ